MSAAGLFVPPLTASCLLGIGKLWGRMTPLIGLSTPTKERNTHVSNNSHPRATAPLTVVLVYGAFADASSWTGVLERLLAGGVKVMALANPLHGISIDSSYIASVFDQIPGPVMAERAGAKMTEVAGSHVIMISQPQAVTDVILTAMAAVS